MKTNVRNLGYLLFTFVLILVVSYCYQNAQLKIALERDWNHYQEAFEAYVDIEIADSLSSNSIPSITEQLVGYWADIRQISDDGRKALDGFYFAENGTGLLFHSLEGSFEITSYRCFDDKLIISFINMEGEIVELPCQVQALSENALKLILTPDSSGAVKTYKRFLSIENTSCTGTYLITEMDGTVIDISGYRETLDYQHYQFSKVTSDRLGSLTEEIKELFSADELAGIIIQLEDHYADLFRHMSNRDLLVLDINSIERINNEIIMEYDFYGIAEGWSLRIGTVVIGKEGNGLPYIISDNIDEAEMEIVKKEMREWAGVLTEP